MSLRAILFDFDGVIADTENIHVAAWQRTFTALGWDVPDEVCARAAEVDDRAFLAEVFEGKSIEGGDIEGWVLRKQRLTASLLADSPRLYPGVAELVGRLRPHYRLGVVTTTWRENVGIVLGASHLAEAFEVVIGKEDVRGVKPDPEGYRLALSRLEVRAGEAVALEDSASGLAAARAAGLRTLAVGHRLPRGDWVGPSEFVADLRKPADLVERLRSLAR